MKTLGDGIGNAKIVFVELNNPKSDIQRKIKGCQVLCTGGIDPNLGPLLGGGRLSMEGSQCKGQEIGGHPWRGRKGPNPCLQAFLDLDFRHIGQGNISLFLVKGQAQIKPSLGSRFIH